MKIYQTPPPWNGGAVAREIPQVAIGGYLDGDKRSAAGSVKTRSSKRDASGKKRN